jgi:hypothetical protein
MSESTNETGPKTVVESYGHTIDLATLPASSQLALMRRGLAHYLGNEQASKVTAWSDKQDGEVTDAAKAEAKAAFIAEAVKVMTEGNMGHGRVGTPRGTQLETIMRRIAESEIRAILKSNGVALPSGDKTVKLGAQEFTRQALIERRLAQHGDRIRKDAEAEQKKLERVAKASAGEGEGAEALGL